MGAGMGMGQVLLAGEVVVATDQGTAARERGGQVQNAVERAARNGSVEKMGEAISGPDGLGVKGGVAGGGFDGGGGLSTVPGANG
jgi:hypothetical protein